MNRISPIVAGAAALVFSRPFVLRLALCIAPVLLAPLSARAQCDTTLQCCVTPQPGGNPTCGDDSPADLPRTGASVGAGNPVDIITGNKYQRETDLPALPGVLGLELVRHYNSALRHRDTGGLGRGWRLSYQAELHAGHESLSIVQSDGKTLRFARGFAEPDTYTGADEQQGRVRRVPSTSGVHYTWTWPSGRTLRFDNGKLTQIREPSGEFVSLQHAPGGELVLVRDPQGRAMHLIYDSKRRLQAIDTPVGRYTYTQHGRPANLVKVTHPGEGAATRTYHYDDTRHPQALTGITGSITDAAPQRLGTWTYDDKGHAVSSVKGDGRDNIDRVTIQRRHTDEGGEATLTNSLGHTTRYRWRTVAGASRLVDVIGPGCSTCGQTNVRHVYDPRGRLTETIRLDDNGKPAETTRHMLDPLGRVVLTGRILHHAGKAQPVQWLVRYRYATATDRTPAAIVRPSVIAGKEHTLRIERNDIGQPTSITEQGYSPLDQNFQPVAEGAPLSRTTTYAYTRINGRSLLAQMDGPLPNGPSNSPKDSDITQLHYDEDGNRVTRVTYPMELTAQFKYDAAGRVVAHTPMDGVPVQQVLNAFGQVIEWQRGGLKVTVGHDVNGLPAHIQRNDGARFTLEYDAAGRAIAVTDTEGSRREVHFDSEGRIRETLARDASGQVPFEPSRYEYDPSGRLIADARGLRITYDSHGRLIRTTDNLQRSSLYRYDQHARLVEHEQRVPSLATPRLFKTSHDDDPNRVLTKLLYRDVQPRANGLVAGNGATTRADVDDFGRTVRLSSPDTGVTVSSHDESDGPVLVIDAEGNETRFRHDASGRIISRIASNPNRPGDIDEARWSYAGPHLVESGNAHQTTLYRWDGSGRLSEQITRLTGSDKAVHTFVSQYRYDELGRLIEQRLPDGLKLVQQYDPNGQPSAMSLRFPNGQEQPIVKSRRQDAVHGLKEIAFGNGVVTAYAKDRRGRIAGIATTARRDGKPPTVFYSQRIQYDEGDRVVLIHRDGREERYAYDAFDRMTYANTMQGHRHFAYDAVGNRTAVSTPRSESPGSVITAAAVQQAWSYQVNSNRLVRTADPTNQTGTDADLMRRYDANGSTASIGTTRFGYGVTGRLERVSDGIRELARYRFNQRGERVSKQTPARTTYFLYAGNKIVAEADHRGRIATHYLYMGHMPIAKIETDQGATVHATWTEVRPSILQRSIHWLLSIATGVDDEDRPEFVSSVRTLFLHADHPGAPRLATDKQGQVAWRSDYTAFGNAASTEEDPDGDGQAVVLNLRLPGQYMDFESQMHYNRFRTYDPAVGRYLESDPIGLHGGINTYSYALNSPINAIDPLGLFVEMTFDASSGTLRVSDLDRRSSGAPEIIISDPNDYVPARWNQTLVLSEVFTGENRRPGGHEGSMNVPIPVGQYEILSNRQDTDPAHASWYRLDAVDHRPRNDRHEPTARDGFRLHLGYNSFGCVTVTPTSENRRMYELLHQVMNTTSTAEVSDNAGIRGTIGLNGSLTRYGRLTVQ